MQSLCSPSPHTGIITYAFPDFQPDTDQIMHEIVVHSFFDFFYETVHGHVSDLLVLDADCRQSGTEIAGDGHVVKTDDRHVFRYSVMRIFQGVYDADCHDVIGNNEQRRKLRRFFDNGTHIFIGAVCSTFCGKNIFSDDIA